MKININGIELYYEKLGSGKPLIMIHGNGESHHIFDKAANILSKKYTVYLIDSRGHGESVYNGELHYDDMAEDIYEFINELKIDKPVYYGFSDGGILGILLSIKYPDLFSSMIISGVNIMPEGIKKKWLLLFKLIYKITKSKSYKMMITEPNIDERLLEKIKIPTYITAGSRDMISIEHMEDIAKRIPISEYRVFKGYGHGGYIVNSDIIGKYIIEVDK